MAARRFRACARAPSTSPPHRLDRLAIALELGLGAAGANDDARAAGQVETQHIVGEGAGFDDALGSDPGRRGGQPPHEGGPPDVPARRLVPREKLSVTCAPWRAWRSSRACRIVLPGRLDGGERGHRQRRGEAVLVAHVGADRVAEGLLVGEDLDQIGPLHGRPRQPLEAGERLGVGGAVGLGHAGQERGRDDARDDQAPRARGHLGEQPVPEQGADVVAGQAAGRRRGPPRGRRCGRRRGRARCRSPRPSRASGRPACRWRRAPRGWGRPGREGRVGRPGRPPGGRRRGPPPPAASRGGRRRHRAWRSWRCGRAAGGGTRERAAAA